MLLLGARVGYAYPLSLTVYSGCFVFVWLAVELGRLPTPPIRPDSDNCLLSLRLRTGSYKTNLISLFAVFVKSFREIYFHGEDCVV